jgi:glutathione S-transferase
MATTFLQKVRLWWRGSQRRREDFVAKNANWSGGQAPSPVQPREGQARAPVLQIDREGLQSAYLDQSGAILYYLDLESGDVLESRIELNDPRYARVPTQDDAADRDAFLIAHLVDARPSFREAIAKDRALERAWYNFKNERAITAIESWLKTIKRSG